MEQYRMLIAKVDSFCGAIAARFANQMACCRGCDSCCSHIGVMPVERVALALALASLPAHEVERIRGKAREAHADSPCPLLEDGGCLLYESRPIICRTHGLPILVVEDGGRRIDHCPLNFQGAGSLPGDAVLNLETLNTALAAVNALFLKELGERAADFPERLPIAEALLLEIDLT